MKQKGLELRGTITHTVKPTHPDIQGMPEKYWKGKTFEYEDEYSFDENFTREEAEEYIRRDLRRIAGGGYNDKHIDNVKIRIRKVTA